MVTFVAIIALLFFAVAVVGLISLGMLALIWGPAAIAAFATFVTLQRADADGLTTLGAVLLAFIVVRLLTGQLIRAGLRIAGRLTHAY